MLMDAGVTAPLRTYKGYEGQILSDMLLNITLVLRVTFPSLVVFEGISRVDAIGFSSLVMERNCSETDRWLS